MYYMGLGTTEEMVRNLTLSYSSRGINESGARRLAEEEVMVFEYTEGQKLRIEKIIPRRKKLGKYSASTGGNVLWKVENGVHVYFPVGAHMLTCGQHILHVATSPERAWAAWSGYEEHLDAVEEIRKALTFEAMSLWFASEHGYPLPARDQADHMMQVVAGAIKAQGWTFSTRRFDHAGVPAWLACVEAKEGRAYNTHHEREDLALLTAYGQAVARWVPDGLLLKAA